MKIKYLGHSCFIVDDGKVRWLTDPFEDIGIPLKGAYADVVTVSHGHYDHNAFECVGKAPVLAGDCGSERGLQITSLITSHDDVGGLKRGKNKIYKIKIGGHIICHAGDIGERLNDEIADFLSDAELIFLPVGGVYTIGPKEAKEYADSFNARIIPMHYAEEGKSVKLMPLSDFTRLYPDKDVLFTKEGEIETDIVSLPKITVMKREV